MISNNFSRTVKPNCLVLLKNPTDAEYRYTKSGKAVECRDADLDLSDLTIEVTRHQGLAKSFHAMR
ncbi:hypothetical protein CLV88_103406, partial [Shimia abyssi]